MRLPLLALPVLLLAAPAAAEVTRASPIVEQTGYTLHAGEWKFGLLQSSYGLTERLQLDSSLLLDSFFLNAGVKYQLVDAPNLALAVNGWGGGSAILALAGTGLYGFGGEVDATLPLAEKLALNLSGGWQLWQISEGASAGVLQTGRLQWFTVRGSLEYVFRPKHVFFLTAGTPTSWIATAGSGGHDFDALDFWQATAGYQLSSGSVNFRVDAGWGASLFGRGPVVSLDFYVRK